MMFKTFLTPLRQNLNDRYKDLSDDVHIEVLYEYEIVIGGRDQYWMIIKFNYVDQIPLVCLEYLERTDMGDHIEETELPSDLVNAFLNR